MRAFRTWCDSRATAQPRNRATAQPRRAEGRIIFTADAAPGAVKSSSHTGASFTGLADAASRTVGSASRTADGFIHTAGSINRTADAANHPAGSLDRMAGRIIRPADASSRTAGRVSRANKSFIRAGKSSSRAVFGQKQTKTPKNRPFYPSRRADRSKGDSCSMPDDFSFNAPPHPGHKNGSKPHDPHPACGHLLPLRRAKDILPQLRWRRGRHARRLDREPATGLAGRSLATSNCPKAFPSPVGRERVRVRAFPFSAVQPTTNNHP